jgi:hypothetical protein
LRDRDAKFCRAFDDLFRSEGAEVVLTPVQAPNANAVAERFVGTVRAECLDWLLIVGRTHLDRALRVYVGHYNRHRPHRALGLEAPDPPADPDVICQAREGRMHRRDLLGGLLHEYGELHERISAPHGASKRDRARRSRRSCGRSAVPEHYQPAVSHPSF